LQTGNPDIRAPTSAATEAAFTGLWRHTV